MYKFVVFLRGINVGGKNRVSMPILRESLEKEGYKDVVTYINSGNVLLSTPNQEELIISKNIEEIIKKTFQLDIPVYIIRIDKLKEIINNQPIWWGDKDKAIIHYAIFLLPSTTLEEVFRVVGDIKPEYETIDSYGDIIYWSAPRDTFTKSRWSKIASSSVNNKVTIRNANTVHKMLELAKKQENGK